MAGSHSAQLVQTAAARCLCAALLLTMIASLASAAPDQVLADEPLRPSAHALLRRGIEANMAGDAAASAAALDALNTWHPEHPAGGFLETQTWFWQIFHDAEKLDSDEAIIAASESAIARAEAWLERDRDNAEAHFYAGLAHMDLGRLGGLRGRYYQAGRSGERARAHLEKALEARPDWVDARYQLGAYYFFASLIPELVTRWLGWLWFIPTSDADLGLAYLEEVAAKGDLFRDDAILTLANVYTYHRPGHLDEAERLFRDLHTRYPDNPLIQFELIEVLFLSERYDETIAECLRLEADPRETAWWRGRKNVARVWRARAELMKRRPERALEILAPFVAEPIEVPHWGAAWVDFTRAQVFDVQGRRDEALALYRKLGAYERPQGSNRAEEEAEAYLEEPFDLGPRMEAR